MFKILNADYKERVKEFIEFIGIDGKQYRASLSNGNVIGIFDAMTNKRLETKGLCSLTGLSKKELRKELDNYYDYWLNGGFEEDCNYYKEEDYEYYENYEEERPKLTVIKGGKR